MLAYIPIFEHLTTNLLEEYEEALYELNDELYLYNPAFDLTLKKKDSINISDRVIAAFDNIAYTKFAPGERTLKIFEIEGTPIESHQESHLVFFKEIKVIRELGWKDSLASYQEELSYIIENLTNVDIKDFTKFVNSVRDTRITLKIEDPTKDIEDILNRDLMDLRIVEKCERVWWSDNVNDFKFNGLEIRKLRRGLFTSVLDTELPESVILSYLAPFEEVFGKIPRKDSEGVQAF